ncbi:hypothetical protein [Saccharopolyspora elongata]|uniref:Uncharacterized protein n=1 Tax=Saccharopolyspora elongata TaxID=2530387 RepID=A0A4V2YJ10_9PSEU|nr:hypothetical protein [Saccharopolyspora elongata]TDD37037.1 hypothetical protein E1288_41005 [Saccharopolyspora elongata]
MIVGHGVLLVGLGVVVACVADVRSVVNTARRCAAAWENFAERLEKRQESMRMSSSSEGA